MKMKDRSEQKVPVTFGAACAVSEEMLYVASFPDSMDEEQAFSRLFVLNLALPERWFHHDIVDGTVNGVAFRSAAPGEPRACLALTEDGRVETYSSSQQSLDVIADPLAPDSTEGGFTAITHIGDATFACGAGSRIYRYSAGGWKRLSLDIEAPVQLDLQAALDQIGVASRASRQPDMQAVTDHLRRYTVLSDIAGLSGTDVYACGTDGVIVHWDGERWTPLHSGTRQHLHAIHCVSDSEVLVCGHHGTILRGSHKTGFKRIPIGNVETNVWSVRSYKGAIYVGTDSGLRVVSSTGLEQVRLPVEVPYRYAVAALATAGDALWVVADRFVLRLTENDWEVIEHPDNR